ncbi:MAG TPA: hypothetical protein VI259_19580 [Gemmatimonadaceae bacterium]
MSENQQHLQPDDGIPTFEPWLGVASAALVPAALSLFVPASFLIPLIVATVALIAASLVMWWRQDSRRRGGEP